METESRTKQLFIGLLFFALADSIHCWPSIGSVANGNAHLAGHYCLLDKIQQRHLQPARFDSNCLDFTPEQARLFPPHLHYRVWPNRLWNVVSSGLSCPHSVGDRSSGTITTEQYLNSWSLGRSEMLCCKLYKVWNSSSSSKAVRMSSSSSNGGPRI